MKTFILNLPHRYDRLERTRKELDVFYPHIWSAKVETDGALGLMVSIKDLMRRCLEAAWHPVMICEDDVRLLYGAQHVRETVYEAMAALPSGWWQCYLGANIENPGSMEKVTEGLYRVNHAKALHACIYSREGLSACLRVEGLPYDEKLAEQLHPRGNSYIINPMLADQYPGWSDIRRKEVNYSWMRERFEKGKNKS